MRPHQVCCVLFALVASTFALIPAAAAQGPDTFTNLQVLPKDISRPALTAIMRGFAGGLGVRCTYCHVAREGAQGNDFPSDALETKKSARVMFRMTRALNADYVSQLSATQGPRTQVTCLTCHRGSAKPPQPLSEILADTALHDGPAAALQRYKDLRSTELESGHYDFRPDSFAGAATRLVDAGKTAEGVALAQQGRELFADSAAYQASLGQLCLQTKDLTCAETALKRALQLEPENAGAKRSMDALKKQQGESR